MYEDVTVDVQPDPDRHLSQGWIYGFGDGPGGYPQEWTAAKSSNWHAFLDPNEEWDQTIYRNNSKVVHQVELCLSNAKRARVYDGWNTPWLTFVSRNLGAWMHAENGLALHVFTSIQRSCPTNMINTAVAVNAAHKMRFAQDLALFNLDLSEATENFDGTAHQEVWQSAPEWQPTREVVERLTAVPDWCELLFGSNIVFEQLVGSLFRTELVMQIAAGNGDYITPHHRGHRRARLRPRPRLHPQPVPVAHPRPRARRDEQGTVRYLARHLGATVPRRRPGAAADLVAAGRQGGHLRRQFRRRHRQVPFPARGPRARHPQGVGPVSMQFGSTTEFSNMCGVTLMNTPHRPCRRGGDGRQGRCGADRVPVDDPRRRPEAAELRLRGTHRRLGQEFDGSIFEEISSTHYGRMVHLDDKTLLFASPEDAAEYIGFDLTAQ